MFWFGTAEAGEPYRLLRLDGGFMKWGAPELGAGATVTYAIATERRDSAEARNCRAMAPLGPLLTSAGVSMPVFLEELRAAFVLWEEAANLTFKLVAPDQAQILFGAQAVPRGRAFTNVDYEDAAASDTHRLRQSLVCLNPATPWKVGFDGNLDAYDLRYVLAHEIGHAIGLDHPGAQRGHLMSFRYDEDSRGLSAGDIAGIERLYGPRLPMATVASEEERRARVASSR